MAIDQGTATLTVASQERTWRVNIETAKDADPIVTVYREKIMTAPDGSVISREEAPSTARSLSAVADQAITVPGTSIVLTVAQLAAAIAATADKWRKDDIAAPLAKPAG
jgi:hypothetical protein